MDKPLSEKTINCTHCHRDFSAVPKLGAELKCTHCGKVLLREQHFPNKKDHTGVRSDKSSSPHTKSGRAGY